jgi:hypothetical protein
MDEIKQLQDLVKNPPNKYDARYQAIECIEGLTVHLILSKHGSQ